MLSQNGCEPTLAAAPWLAGASAKDAPGDHLRPEAIMLFSAVTSSPQPALDPRPQTQNYWEAPP